MIKDIVVVGHNVLQGKTVSFFIGINRVTDKYILCRFAQVPKMHKYFICNTKFGETSTETFTFSLRSHKRLTLLVEDAYVASSHAHICPLLVDTSKIATCKMPNDIRFMYNAQPNDSMPIKDKLRYVRLMAGYGQKELAALVGIDRVTLTRLENGDVSEENMKTDLLTKIAIQCGFEKTFCCNKYHTFIASDSGHQIKQYRKQNRLTQAQLAEQLQVSKTTVKRWEKNINKPPLCKVTAMFPQLIVSDAG